MAENGKTKFEMSIDTRITYDLLMKAAIGETVTYAAIAKELGRPVSGAEPHLQSALHRCLSNDNRVFANVSRVGYKRLGDVEIVATGERETEMLRRRAKRAGKRLTCVENFDGLPNDMKVKHNTYLSMFGAISAMTKTGAVKKLEGEVFRAQAALPLAKTLEAFKA